MQKMVPPPSSHPQTNHAWFNAGASLTPSPVIAATCPIRWIDFTISCGSRRGRNHRICAESTFWRFVLKSAWKVLVKLNPLLKDQIKMKHFCFLYLEWNIKQTNVQEDFDKSYQIDRIFLQVGSTCINMFCFRGYHCTCAPKTKMWVQFV